MEGPHAGYSQGEESRRERWKSNYFFFFLLLLSTIPMLTIMCQTNKSGGKKIEAHSPSTRNQLGSLGVRISDLCSRSVSAPQYSLIHPRPLSLRGAILVLFCERASSSTYRMRFVPIKKIYVQRKPPLTYLIETSHVVLQHCATFVFEASHYTCSPGCSAHCGLAA